MDTKEEGQMEVPSSLEFLNSQAFLLFLKVVTLLILAIYTIFALMITRQVKLMGHALASSVSSVVRVVAFFHLILAIGLLILAWIIL